MGLFLRGLPLAYWTLALKNGSFVETVYNETVTVGDLPIHLIPVGPVRRDDDDAIFEGGQECSLVT